MQISRALAKSKRASLHFRKRLSLIFVALLIVVIVLVVFRGFPQGSVAQGSDPTPTPAPSSGGNDGGFYVYPDDVTPTPTPTATPTDTPTDTPAPTFTPMVTPEFGFYGGIIALIVCFAAFAVFAKTRKSKP